METTSQLFLLLVLFFSVSGARATVEHSEDDFEENNHRVDAEQEPFTKVAMSGGAISTLFRSCLESGKTFDAKFASIDTPGGITYTRYVPDSSMLAFRITWENAVGSVSDIFGCTAVAGAGGYSMFKYSATDGCQLATDGYDLEKVPDCEDNEENAVFIKPAVAGSCAFPYVAVGPGSICLVLTDKPMTRDAAISFCESFEMVLYFPLYQPSHLSLVDVITKIKNLGYKRNIWVAPFELEGDWAWPFSPQDWVGSAFPTDDSTVAYLDWQADWKLRGAQKSALAGAVCIQNT